MSKKKRFNLCCRTFLILVVGISLIFVPGIQNDVQAGGKGGAFVGGLIGGHVLTKIVDNQERQTQAMERQERRSYSQPQPQASAPAQTQAAPAQQTVEQRLQKLDDLAQKGYISPEEYKTRRKAILDSM